MPTFDISSLLDFMPPRYLCEKCLALDTYIPRYPIHPTAEELGSGNSSEQKLIPMHRVCPVCNVKYIYAHEYTDQEDSGRLNPLSYRGWRLNRLTERYLKNRGYSIQFDNVIEHARNLADNARNLQNPRRHNPHYPPLRVLFQALSQAKHFVHFTTYSINIPMIFALKIAAQRIPIRGIVSLADSESIRAELTGFTAEAPNLSIKIYNKDGIWADIPHQKLIFIDGLIAFTGSTNLSISAWRKALQSRDTIEAITENQEVVRLHNRYFSPFWAELSDIGGSIIIGADEVPF
jgi:phosphatidylserine/phosphatidylglycerophosphate/cardiolipin synthase-like enzyme